MKGKNDEIIKKLGELQELSPKKKKLGYKFVLINNPEEMIISITSKGEPNHGKLGGVKKVITAGYFKYKITGNKIEQIFFNNQSKYYCPTPKSLEKAKDFIEIILDGVLVKNEIKFPKCDDTHVVIKETHYYETLPQQGNSPDGTLLIDEYVRLVEDDLNYPRVQLKNKEIVYVDTTDLKEIKKKT